MILNRKIPIIVAYEVPGDVVVVAELDDVADVLDYSFSPFSSETP